MEVHLERRTPFGFLSPLSFRYRARLAFDAPITSRIRRCLSSSLTFAKCQTFTIRPTELSFPPIVILDKTRSLYYPHRKYRRRTTIILDHSVYFFQKMRISSHGETIRRYQHEHTDDPFRKDFLTSTYLVKASVVLPRTRSKYAKFYRERWKEKER